MDRQRRSENAKEFTGSARTLASRSRIFFRMASIIAKVSSATAKQFASVGA